MYRLYDHGTGRFIAETADSDMLVKLIEETAGRIPPRFWVTLATRRIVVIVPPNPGYQTIDVRMEAF